MAEHRPYRTILWASPTLRLARAIYSRLRKMSRSGMLWVILLICLFSCVTGEWLRINKTYICKKLSPPQAKPYKLQPQHGLVWLPDPSWKGRSITCNRIRAVVIFVCPTPPTLPILPGMAKVGQTRGLHFNFSPLQLGQVYHCKIPSSPRSTQLGDKIVCM